MPKPSKTLDIIEDQVVTWDGEAIRYRGALRVDNDGIGSGHADPFHQGDTSLHLNGKPLNADVDIYGVVPQQLVAMVPGIVMGCQGYVTWKGKRIAFVTGDKGPGHSKRFPKGRAGEGSNALCRVFGLSDDPIRGGSDKQEFDWEFYPGIPAVSENGTHYNLQRS